MLPSIQGNIKYFVLEPGQHQICNHLDSFDPALYSDKLINALVCTIATVVIFVSVCQLVITTGYRPRPHITFPLPDCTLIITTGLQVRRRERKMANIADKLDSSNRMTWKFQIKHPLLAKNLWGFIDGTEALQDEASAQQRAEFNKKSQKAFSTIVMLVSSSQLYLITSYEDPRRARTASKNHPKRDTPANKLILKKQYLRMEMVEGTSVEWRRISRP